MMSKIILRILLGSAMAMSGMAQNAETAAAAANTASPASGTNSPAGQNADKDSAVVVAKIVKDGKTTTLTLADIKKRYEMLPAPIQKPELSTVYPKILDRMVKIIIATDEARKSGLDQSDELKQRLAVAQDELLAELYMNQQKPTDKELQDAYAEIKAFSANEVEVRVKLIVTTTKADAQKALADLKANKKFDDVVKARSIDKDNKDKNGDMGFVPLRAFPAEIGEKIKKAAPASVIQEPLLIASAEGKEIWAVIRKEEQRQQQMPDFKDVDKGELSLMVSMKKRKEYEEALLSKATSVELFGMDGKPLPAAAATAAATAAPADAPKPADASKPTAAPAAAAAAKK